jgi:ribosomal protein L37AE/L43A
VVAEIRLAEYHNNGKKTMGRETVREVILCEACALSPRPVVTSGTRVWRCAVCRGAITSAIHRAASAGLTKQDRPKSQHQLQPMWCGDGVPPTHFDADCNQALQVALRKSYDASRPADFQFCPDHR